jgi:membrane protein
MLKVLTKNFWKESWQMLLATFNGFTNDKGLKLSASLAYYTIFSIAPLLILIISLVSVFYGDDAMQDKIVPQISDLVGTKAAMQIQEMIQNLQISGKTGIAVVIGVTTLIIGATTVFLEIQDSINMIWRVKAKPKKGWLQMLKNRFLSFSLIISLGFLLLASLVINGIIVAMQNTLIKVFPHTTIFIFDLINLGVTFLIISFLFGIIFKFLPDVKIPWKSVRIGAFFTAVLFMLGRYIISIYIEKAGTASAYGAAGSLIIILLWIYYISAILYFGAEFTRVYADKSGCSIEPADYAVHVEQTEVEKNVDFIPPPKV